MAENNSSIFRRLTRLFRSGPVIKRNILQATDSKVSSSAYDQFRKNQSAVYSNAMSAYGTYDRMARYSDFSEMEYCLHGDTKIAVPDGWKTLKELSEEYGLDKSFIVYAYDHNKKQIVPALGKQARKTRTDMSYKVTFDSGKEIIGTANHKLMLRDGTYKRIDELLPGDAMMPFYRKDFFGEDNGYMFIYNMDYESSKMRNGWNTEHKIIAEWASGRKVQKGEYVHHRNFIKYDNRPENLQIMDAKDHHRLHAEIINGKKWDHDKNGEWIEKFKVMHSKFMSENNPAERKDITFNKILNMCENEGFNLYHLCRRFDTDPNVIKKRLKTNGFESFEIFAKAYNRNWKNNGWDNQGENNPRYDRSLTFQEICNTYKKGMSSKRLAELLNTTQAKINNRVKSNGYRGYGDFKKNYNNHKVVSVEKYGVIDLYDLTVDGYKNFATDTVISHNTPEIASALDIYAEESVAADESGKTLHIYSENPKIKQILNELFYDTLNVEFNLTAWVRNLVKYGDFFLFNDVHPQYGVINAKPLPISEVEREEGFDPNDPMAVRFRWVTNGNQVLENWQISHMRLLGNDAFLPYGSSVLEPARRIWRQMILLEDAMLVHRIVRAPGRKVFYIDVGNVPPEDVANYMEQAQSALKRSPIVDKQTGRVDLRYNPLSVDEDYFVPVRGGDSGTKIESFASESIAGETSDVEYIQKKLFAALKIPKAYLGYDEGLGAKATLSQEDIRFSRTIARVQRTILAEMNKIAIVHLYCNGFSDEDLLDFKLMLSNPSTIAQQQKLDLYKARFDAAGSCLSTPGLVDRTWVQKNVLKLTDEELKSIKKGLKNDKRADLELDAVQLTPLGGPENDTGGMPQFGGGDSGGLGGLGGGIDLGGTSGSGETPLSENQSIEDDSYPVKVQKMLELSLNELDEEEYSDEELNEKRKKIKRYNTSGVDHSLQVRKRDDPADGGMMKLNADLKKSYSMKSDMPIVPSSKNLEEDFDINEYLEEQIMYNANIDNRLKSTLNRLDIKFGDNINRSAKSIIISESESKLNSSGDQDDE